MIIVAVLMAATIIKNFFIFSNNMLVERVVQRCAPELAGFVDVGAVPDQVFHQPQIAVACRHRQHVRRWRAVVQQKPSAG